MTSVSNSSCTTNFITPMEKVDNKEFGIPKGLMTIVYTTKTTWKIIYVLIRKDKHAIHGVGQYMIESLIGARKEVGKELLELYAKFIGNLNEILNHQ